MNDIDYNTDYYDILNINDGATQREIKKAYYYLAKKFHPDSKNNNLSDTSNAEEFKKIGDAYNILGNEEKKKQYDNVRNNINMFSENSPFGFSGDHIFNFPENIHTQRASSPISIILDVTIEDIYNCVVKDINIKRKIFCSECNGEKINMNVYLQSPEKYNCAKCLGRGMIKLVKFTHHTRIEIPTICPQCNGKKILLRPEIICKKCNGKGINIRNKNIKYKLSHTILHKSKIIIKGKGNQINPEYNPGDVIVIINQIDHMQFRRSKNGKDLLTVEKISLYFSLGCYKNRILEINTISNDILKIKIPDNVIIKPRTIKKIKNMGFNGGCLYIIFEVKFPDSIPFNKLKYILPNKEINILDSPEKTNIQEYYIYKRDNDQKISDNFKEFKVSNYKLLKYTKYESLNSTEISNIYSIFPVNKKIKNLSENINSNDSDNINIGTCPMM